MRIQGLRPLSLWPESKFDNPDEFGWWFTGLFDGEGCFLVNPRKGGRAFVPKATVSQLGENGAILELIKFHLGGSITKHEANKWSPRPMWIWTATNKVSIERVIHHFDEYSLKGVKLEEYEIWRWAAEEYLKHHRARDNNKMILAWAQLKDMHRG